MITELNDMNGAVLLLESGDLAPVRYNNITTGCQVAGRLVIHKRNH